MALASVPELSCIEPHSKAQNTHTGCIHTLPNRGRLQGLPCITFAALQCTSTGCTLFKLVLRVLTGLRKSPCSDLRKVLTGLRKSPCSDLRKVLTGLRKSPCSDLKRSSQASDRHHVHVDLRKDLTKTFWKSHYLDLRKSPHTHLRRLPWKVTM